MAMARDYYPGMGDDTLAEVRWLDNEDLEFGDDADVLVAWDGTNLNILPATTDIGSVRVGNGTLLMDLRVTGSAAGNYAEFDASEDQMNIVVAARAVTGADFGISVAYVPTLGGGDSVVGVNATIAPTDSGGVGTWASAFFGSVNLAVDGVGGYVSGAELEIIASGVFNTCEYGVLVLNTNDSNTGAPPNRAYIWLNDYGTRDPDNFVDFRTHARAAVSDTVIISQMTPVPFDTAVRCRVSGVPVWLYGSTVGPATLADFQWTGSAAGNYVEYDASEDQLNVVVAARAITGADFGISVEYVPTLGGGDSLVGVNSAIAPADSGGAGVWASAFFGSVTLAVDGVGGYVSGAELEIAASGVFNTCEYAVLVLNTNDSNTGAPPNRAFIWLNDYGTREIDNLFDFRNQGIGTNDGTVLLSSSADRGQSHAIRIRIGGVPYWIPLTNTSP